MIIKIARLVFTWTRISAWQSASRPRASLPLSLQLGGGRTLVEIPLHIIWFFDYQLTIGYIHEQREEGGKDWKSIIVAHQTKEGRKVDYYDDDDDDDDDGHLSRRASEHS